jgi:hypothetical protein
MNLITRVSLYAGLVCALPALAQTTGGFAASTQGRATIMQLPTRLQPLFNRTKAVCFTRFVMEVPASAKVVYGRMTVDTEVSRYAGQAAELEKKIEEYMRENMRRESAGTAHPDAPLDDRAGKRLPGKMPGLTHLLSKSDIAQYNLHSFFVLGDDIYLMEALGFFSKRIHESIAEHEMVARHLSARKDEEIPTEEGVCIDGAIANLRPPFENIQIGIRLAEFPDVHFSIETKKNFDYVKPQQDFLDRYASAERTARMEGKSKWYDRIKFFSRDARTVLEWRGHQVLARVPALPGSHDRHEFNFYSAGNANDPFHPEIDIELDTGLKGNKKGARSPSLTDAEALALWNKLLDSIRVRQVVPPGAAKPVPTLGMVAGTGPCPQTGWWKCLDAEQFDGQAEVKGGQLRYFHAGVSMPQAILQSRSGWSRLFGAGQTVQSARPSQWQLVDRRWTARPLEPYGEQVNHVGGAPAEGAVTAVAKVTLAPGAKCACGTPSPASGWWGCADVDAIELVRWFAQGESTPDIRYRVNLHWWQRLTGQPAVIARKTAWQFLRAGERSLSLASADANLPGAE